MKPEDVENMMPLPDYFACWKNGERKLWPPEPENPEPGEPPEIDLRFKVGDRVECCVARGPDGWRPGTVISLWYRAVSWPTGQFAPYQIKLDDHQVPSSRRRTGTTASGRRRRRMPNDAD